MQHADYSQRKANSLTPIVVQTMKYSMGEEAFTWVLSYFMQRSHRTVGSENKGFCPDESNNLSYLSDTLFHFFTVTIH